MVGAISFSRIGIGGGHVWSGCSFLDGDVWSDGVFMSAGQVDGGANAYLRKHGKQADDRACA